MDQWSITPQERLRHEDQFRSLNPAPNGMVTGTQARNFFLQSGLQPMVLAQIWGLSDINGDGQMDITEFSIACKMITMKLKGFEIPPTLPPALAMAATNPVGQMMPPNSLNIMGMQPQSGMNMNMGMGMAMPRMQAPMGTMMMPGQHGMMPGQQGMMPGQPGMMPGQQGMMPGQPGMMQPQVAATMGMPMGQMGMPNMGMQVGPMGMGVQPMGMQTQMTNMGQMGGMGQVMGQPMTHMAPGMMAPQHQMMGVQQAAMPMPVASAISSGQQSGASTPGGVSVDWAIPQATRARYGQQFQSTDRTKTGFLAGAQARNLLLQSGLPQNILAQVWTLSDVDADGRLSAEEFILAGHLCDVATKGEPLPPALPPNMIPPSLRKGGTQAAVSGSTPVAGGTPKSDDASRTFEDKRRENFNKGQAELERRRQSLIDQQKKEEEDRKKKEKDEKEERERQKLDAERRRRAEIEIQRAKQVEAKRLAEEEKWKLEQQRYLARQEMERQRLAEWEKQRKAELMQHRQREQEKVLNLKARHEHITADLDKVRDKVKSLTDGISETRSGVTEVKSFIDGMRTSRDTKMQDMTNLKNKLKDQNARLIQVTQEKAKLEAKVKRTDRMIDEGVPEDMTEFDFKQKEKEKVVTELRERLQKLKDKEEETRQQLENEKSVLTEHTDQLRKIIESCKALYDEFDVKRRDIKAEKAKRIRELTDPDHAWGVENDEPLQEGSNHVGHEHMTLSEGGDASSYIEYKAIYDFESRNPDELPFRTGDIILVHPGQPHEPGWLGGELNGKVGWFPETYVERIADSQPALQTITEEPFAVDASRARALHDWAAVQTDNEISFSKDDVIIVLSKVDPDWWYGKNETNLGKEGYFPSSYVTIEDLDPRGSTPVQPPEVVGTSPQKPTSASRQSEGLPCVALYPYNSEEAGDLSFEAGEEILVIKKDGDWWTGKVGNRTGVFPFNYVQPLEDEVNTNNGLVIPPLNPPNEPLVSSDSETKYNGVNWADSASHVTHQVGTSGTSSEPQPNLSNAAVEVAPAASASPKPAPVDVVTAEDQGAQSATRSRSRSKSKKRKDEGDGKSSKKPELATVVAPYTASGKEQLTLIKGQMILVRKKTDTGWWQGEIQASKGKKRQVGWFPASYVKLMESGLEKGQPAAADPKVEALKFRALFPYTSQNEDELSFQFGDIIELISKDEEAWWRGNLNGVEGVFPSNYVEQVE